MLSFLRGIVPLVVGIMLVPGCGAEEPAAAQSVIELKIPGIESDADARLIEERLAQEEGVAAVSVDRERGVARCEMAAGTTAAAALTAAPRLMQAVPEPFEAEAFDLHSKETR